MIIISVASSCLIGILQLTAFLGRSEAFVGSYYPAQNHALRWNFQHLEPTKQSSRARAAQRRFDYDPFSTTTVSASSRVAHAAPTQTHTQPSPSKTMSKKRLGSAMAFLTGIADIALFTKYKGFATMMSGNTLWMALAVIESRYVDVAYYASLIACYCAGVGTFRRADVTLQSKSLTLVCAPMATAFFIGSDICSNWIGTGRWLPMMLLATGFGVINSVGAEVAGSLTFVITGHLTRLTNMFVDRISRTAGRKKLTDADKAARDMNVSIFGSFFAGAATACAIAASAKQGGKVGTWLWKYTFSLLGLSYGLLFLRQDRDTIGGWWTRKDDEMCDLDDDGENCQLDDSE